MVFQVEYMYSHILFEQNIFFQNRQRLEENKMRVGEKISYLKRHAFSISIDINHTKKWIKIFTMLA